jgi:hypothetical protein
MLQRKPSKWKKIGGLFKPKQPQSVLGAGFHQTTGNGGHGQSPDDLEPAQDSRLQQTSVLPLDSRPSPEHNSREIWRQTEIDIKRTQLDTHERPKTGMDAQIHCERFVGGHIEEGPALGLNQEHSRPFLDVDIPSIHMERYSVMFGNLLANGPSSNLLARRSRTLGMLKTQEEEVCFVCHSASFPVVFNNP